MNYTKLLETIKVVVKEANRPVKYRGNVGDRSYKLNKRVKVARQLAETKLKSNVFKLGPTATGQEGNDVITNPDSKINGQTIQGPRSETFATK